MRFVLLFVLVAAAVYLLRYHTSQRERAWLTKGALKLVIPVTVAALATAAAVYVALNLNLQII